MGFVALLALAAATLFTFSGQRGVSPVDTLRAVLTGGPMPGTKYPISGKHDLFPPGFTFAPPDPQPAGPRSGIGAALIRPVPGVVTSPFGMRWGRMHEGVDFGCPLGTAVKAAASGTVAQASWNGGYGNYILLHHGGGIDTAYGHLSRYAVHAGDTVTQGQTIAYSGSTGDSTGPHLHFEVHVGGKPVDPLTYVPR